MLPKYTIEYCVEVKKHSQLNHYGTDDPVAAEQFLIELLKRGFGILAIKHEGVDLPRQDFDRMIRTAAAMVAAQCICESLSIKSDEERFRFGFAA